MKTRFCSIVIQIFFVSFVCFVDHPNSRKKKPGDVTGNELPVTPPGLTFKDSV